MTGEVPEFGRLPLPPELSPRPGDRRGAPRQPPRRGRRPRRWSTVVAGFFSFLVLATSAFGYAYYQQINGNVHRVNVFGYIAEKNRPAKAPDSAENILLVGSDSRVGATPAQLAQASTTQDGGGTNTDTIILLHISADNTVTMVSFPRDSYVAIPGHGTFKINSAYADGEADHKGGGPALLTQTVENLSGVHIDHYVEVNFFQFIDISNAIGGVQVCLTQAQNDHFSGINLPAGYSTISGSQALAFVRQRHGLPEGDIDRIKRQQRFISAMVKKVKAIRDPLTLDAVIEHTASSLTVDSGLSGQGLIGLVDRLKNVDLNAVQFETVPVANIGASARLPNGQDVSYVQLDTAALPAFFTPIAHDQPTSPAANQPAASPAVAPSAIDVRVLNGRRTAGAAGQARSELQQFGFNVTGIGDSTSTPTTTIRYAAPQLAAATELAKAIPAAHLTEDSTLGSTITLTLGTDNLPITNPTIQPAPAAAPTASPSPSAAAASICGV